VQKRIVGSRGEREELGMKLEMAGNICIFVDITVGTYIDDVDFAVRLLY
jgi:hypothetical protein